MTGRDSVQPDMTAVRAAKSRCSAARPSCWPAVTLRYTHA